MWGLTFITILAIVWLIYSIALTVIGSKLISRVVLDQLNYIIQSMQGMLKLVHTNCVVGKFGFLYSLLLLHIVNCHNDVVDIARHCTSLIHFLHD